LAGDRISEWQGSVSGLITGIAGCCARAASGNVAAAPPSSALSALLPNAS